MNGKKKEGTFFWFIENYSYCWHHKSGENLVSPTFAVDGQDGTSWTLKLHRGTDLSGRIIVVFLRRNEDRGPVWIFMNYVVSIVAENGSTLISQKYSNNFQKEFEVARLIFMNPILSKQNAEYFPNDILTIRCKFWYGDGSVDKVGPICARTRIGIERISFLHEVESFSSLKPKLKPVQIQSRSVKGCAISSSVHITDGTCCEKKVVLEITPSRNALVLVKCRIALLDTSGKIIKCAEADNRFNRTEREIRKLPLSLTKFAIMHKKKEYLTNDKLSLLCECTFSTGVEFQKIEGSQDGMTTTPQNFVSNNLYIKYVNIASEKLAACPSVVDDLKDIYSHKCLTDVELKTKTNSFPAHKIVLCARSPVFKVMMNNDMKEKRSSSIEVDDLEDDIVENLLIFLYSDDIEDLQWDTATKLYYAADKYQIERLKLICSSFLIDNLTISTVIELLHLADTHSDSDLKDVVEDFILEHEKQVFSSDEWKKLIDENPQLAVKTMHLKYRTRK